ncbi:MAG: MBL fold metallo-hydrolase [Pseudomonadota bacterium]
MRWWMKWAIGLAVVMGLAVLGLRIFQTPLMWRVFERAVETNIAADTSEARADGLHVFLCGTGSPIPDEQRAAVCVGVVAGDQAFVFDAGSGGIRKLGRMGFPMGQMEGAFLTHLHSDHIDGLGELLLMSWIGTQEFRSEPLPVRGPRGTQRVVDAFNAAYELDRGYRIAHHGADIATPSGYGGRPIEITLPLGPSSSEVIYEAGDIRVTAIRVNHGPIEPALGYRVDYKDRSISLSGDTVYHPGFVAASRNVDVMFHEAEDPDMVHRMAQALDGVGRRVSATLLRDTLNYHATPEDAARAAEEAGATELVYYHIVPPMPVRSLYPIWLGDAERVFSGRLRVGEDGMIISLPTASEEIVHSSAF